jgi:predicted nuclease with RNAse H fold
VGIDVGARHLHLVALDGDARVVDATSLGAADLDRVTAWVAGATAVGVDSPDRWSTAPHAGDASLAPKFRTARCGEIALGRAHHIWVPWATPVAPAADTWMAAGIDLFAALRAGGHEPLEVFPYAVFRLLHDGATRLAPKRSAAGGAARRRILDEAGVRLGPAGLAGHDAVDAAAAALVALHHARRTARPATCGHDGSAIWLPAPFSGTGNGQAPDGSAPGVTEAAPAPGRRR